MNADMSKQADGSTPQTAEYETPADLILQLTGRFGEFTLDPCATPQTAKADAYFTRKTDGLRQEWWGNVFMNPPYGRGLGQWFEKAAKEARDCQVVGLLPANNTDTAFWHEHVFERGASLVIFVRGRIHFLLDKVPRKESAISSAVVVWEPKRPRHPKIDVMRARL